MATPFAVHLVTPDHEVWSGQASFVIARSASGDMGILAGHEPVLSSMGIGIVHIERIDEEPLIAAVDGGFLSVSPTATVNGAASGTRVDVLAEHVTLEADISSTEIDALERKAQTLHDMGNNAAARSEEAKALVRRRLK